MLYFHTDNSLSTLIRFYFSSIMAMTEMTDMSGLTVIADCALEV